MTACGTQLGHRVGVAEPDALVTEKLGTILSVYFSYARSGADPIWLAGLTGRFRRWRTNVANFRELVRR